MLFTDPPPRGLLVTIDGPNGAGKTTLAGAVAARLRTTGELVHSTRQPSPTWLGDTVRGAERDVRGRGLACLVAGDRHHQVDTEILPRLAEGAVVICDRYVESSIVLQCLDGVDIDYILAINAGLPRPALRIRLIARSDVLAVRLAQRVDDPDRRFERTASRERELELYEQADELLSGRERLPSTVFDTTSSRPDELSASIGDMILAMR